MTTTLPDGAAAVWATATRMSTLDVNGFVAPGATTYVSSALVKATFTPVLETGDDIVVRTAAGDLGVFAKHPDMIKYYTVAIEIATPDPALEQLMAGGLILSSSASALGTPTGLTATPQITLGTLPAAAYAYRASTFNQYGETTASASLPVAVGGTTAGAVVLSGIVIPATAVGAHIFGRIEGSEQLIGTIPNIGSQATSSASGTGAVVGLAVTALTASIPQGFSFQIAGDTNTTKIVFTTTAYSPPGAVAIPVTASQSVTTTITAGAIVPVFVDTGAVTPAGSIPATDTTAGPGAYGYQAPALGAAGNPTGLGLEFFSKAIVGGYQTSLYPYYRTVLPRVTGIHQLPRDVTNANMQSMFEGQGFENPNWGAGPTGDAQFSTNRVFQRVRCSAQIVPTPSYLPIPATLGSAGLLGAGGGGMLGADQLGDLELG